MPDQPTNHEDADSLPKGGQKPLGESLLGDPDSGGLAGQGGMTDVDDDDAED